MGVVKQLGSVIDVAPEIIELRNFQNGKVPLEVVAGHLTTDRRPEHASALQKQLTTTDVGTGTSGTGGYNSSTVFRKTWFGLSIDHTSWCHDRHRTLIITKLTQRTAKRTFRVVTFKPSSLLNHLAYGVYWRSRAGESLPIRR